MKMAFGVFITLLGTANCGIALWGRSRFWYVLTDDKSLLAFAEAGRILTLTCGVTGVSLSLLGAGIMWKIYRSSQ